MERVAKADFVGWGLIALWIATSLFAVTGQNWSLFQSAGALGICAGVIYFAMQRHGTPYPVGAIEMQAMLTKNISAVSDSCRVANANVALLAKAIASDANRNGSPSNRGVEELAAVPVEVIESSLRGSQDRLRAEIDRLETSGLDANREIQTRRRWSEITQAVVVVLGTLQGGFGQFLQGAFG